MLKTSLKICLTLGIGFISLTVKAQSVKQINFADPSVFYHDQTYYLYGTVEEKNWSGGFKVYTSKDKENWSDRGPALQKGAAFGTAGFWAPQVFQYRNKFYMAYTANENIAIAESNSPLGPFIQKLKKTIKAPVKIIDPFVFFDGDKIYLYHVRLQKGNRIFVAEMNRDLSAIKEETAIECISASEDWENTAKSDWGVTEGPTVLKRNGVYYLFYSANDFRNANYAVGYATSNTPFGPWKKYRHNPVLSKAQTGENGSGHGDFFTDHNGKLNYIFHTHESNSQPKGQRRTALISAQFVKQGGKTEVLQMNSKTWNYIKY
jgi:xylan 1,4-beta-xylosidase